MTPANHISESGMGVGIGWEAEKFREGVLQQEQRRHDAQDAQDLWRVTPSQSSKSRRTITFPFRN
jgi:hypothetical protein